MNNKISLLLIANTLLPFILLQAQDPQGCFLNGFQKKAAVIPSYEYHRQVEVFPGTTITIYRTDTIAKVSKYV